MKTSPETQALNILVELFDRSTGYRHDQWTLAEILAWFEGFSVGAQQGKDTNDN